MQDYHLYEYATIRLIPRVERGEFINIGTVLYCKHLRFLESKFHYDVEKINALFKEVDHEVVKCYIGSFEAICKGVKEGGAIGELPLAERFRWLTATRSTIIQTSAVHPAYCKEAEITLDRLFEELVL